MSNKFKLTIDKNITEQNMIESCLMYYHSGYDYMLIFSFYALGTGMNYKKFKYYHNLIEGKNNE